MFSSKIFKITWVPFVCRKTLLGKYFPLLTFVYHPWNPEFKQMEENQKFWKTFSCVWICLVPTNKMFSGGEYFFEKWHDVLENALFKRQKHLPNWSLFHQIFIFFFRIVKWRKIFSRNHFWEYFHANYFLRNLFPRKIISDKTNRALVSFYSLSKHASWAKYFIQKLVLYTIAYIWQSCKVSVLYQCAWLTWYNDILWNSHAFAVLFIWCTQLRGQRSA